MIDFRYHALSLVAVLVALVIGLLLGVSIGDRGLVSTAERALREDVQHRAEEARAEARELEEVLERRDAYGERTFGRLVSNRLVGERVAVIFLHDASREPFEFVRRAVEAAGGELASVSDLRDPDLEALGAAAEDTRYAALPADPALLEPFGRRMGAQVVSGGRLVREVRRELLASSSGTLDGAEAVVLVRGEPDDVEDGELDPSPFIDAFVEGLQAFETPVVGVETSGADPSQIGWFAERNLASVDNVDETSGRASLVFALDGAADGAYGFKETADALVPEALVAR
jgi:hypothetical protein